jgi:hypothetical protein
VRQLDSAAAALPGAVQRGELGAALAAAAAADERARGELRGALAAVEARLAALQQAAAPRDEAVLKVREGAAAEDGGREQPAPGYLFHPLLHNFVLPFKSCPPLTGRPAAEAVSPPLRL